MKKRYLNLNKYYKDYKYISNIILCKAVRKITKLKLESFSKSSITIHECESISSACSIFIESDFQKIKQVVNGNIQYQIDKSMGKADFHLPTIEHTYYGASIYYDKIMCGLGISDFRTSLGLSHNNEIRTFDRAFLSANPLSGLEFGHWVRDCLVSEIHASDSRLPVISTGRAEWQHEPGYRKLTGLECFYGNKININRLIMLDDRGLNSYWASRFLKVRDLIHRNYKKSQANVDNLIFLSRGINARPREPLNISAIQSYLEKNGFKTVIPTSLSPLQIADALKNAQVIVSSEGSHLNHVHYFAPQGVKLVLIQDPNRFSVYHKRFVDINHGHFGFVVGDEQNNKSYNVNIDNFCRLLDKMFKF